MIETPSETPSMRRLRRHAPWALLALFSLAGALFARYGLIENTGIGLACQEETAPWYCVPRLLLIQVNYLAGWSWAALAGGALALVTRSRSAIALGLLAGAAGLVLYNAGPAGAGFLLSVLALMRR